MRVKIGLKAIAAMPPNSILWDTEIGGLNVRRQFSDVVTYSIVYRTLEACSDGSASVATEYGRLTWPASARTC